MEKRNCAVDGCNALEFRSTGICNRHMRDEIALREIDLEALREAAQEESDNAESKGEELRIFMEKHGKELHNEEDFECPRGCGNMSYRELRVGEEFSLEFAVGIPLLAIIYFIGSFVVYDHNPEGASPSHPSLIILALFGAVWIASIMYTYRDIKSKTHICNSCNGRMYEEKAMAYIFDEGSLSKLNSLMDSMPPSSSDLQCPICDVRMRTFSVPYTPADDHEGHRRGHGGVSFDTDDMAVGLAIALVVGAAKAIVPNTKQKIQLDACRECRMFWFDRSEKDELSYGIIG